MRAIRLLGMMTFTFFIFSSFIIGENEKVVLTTNANNCIYPTNNPNVADAIEIQTAIHNAFIEGSIVCLEPNRIYEIDKWIFGYGVSIEGNNATLKIKDGITNDFPMLSYFGGDHPTSGIPIQNNNFFLRNINFDGNRDNINIHLNFKESFIIALYETNHVLIENCHFSKIANNAIYTRTASNFTIQSCSFIDVGPCENPAPCYCDDYACPDVECIPASGHWDAISIISYGTSENIRIDNCHFENVGRHTYEFECAYGLPDADAIHTWANEDDQIENLIITGNYFENISRRAIKIMAGSYVVVTDNVAVNCGRFMANVLERKIENETIQNNITIDCGMFIETAGIESRTKRINVVGNSLVDGKRAFIYSGGTSGISFGNCINNIVDGLDGVGSSDAITYNWVGRGDSNFILNNRFKYKSELATFTVFAVTPRYFRIEGNEFELSEGSGFDKTIVLIANSLQELPGHNIVRHNSFNTEHDNDFEYLITSNLLLTQSAVIDTTNILLVE